MMILFSEHFEGPGFENPGWSTVVGSGSSVDADYQTDLPSGFQTRSLRCYSVGQNAYARIDLPAADDFYLRFEFYAPLFPLSTGNIVPLLDVRSSIGDDLFTYRLYGGWGDGPRHNLVVYHDTRGIQYLIGSSVYTPDVKQVVEIRYSHVEQQWEWRANGVVQQNGMLISGVGLPARLAQVGISAQSFGTIEVIIDNIAVSDSGYLGEYIGGPRLIAQEIQNSLRLLPTMEGTAFLNRGLTGHLILGSLLDLSGRAYMLHHFINLTGDLEREFYQRPVGAALGPSTELVGHQQLVSHLAGRFDLMTELSGQVRLITELRGS